MNKRAVAVIGVTERVQKQIATARVVGKIAVQLGWRETGKALRRLSGRLTKSHVSAAVDEVDTDPRLAISNYQHAVAVDIIAQLESLSEDQLRAIALFESSHRRRRTVLSKISQLLATEQIEQS